MRAVSIALVAIGVIGFTSHPSVQSPRSQPRPALTLADAGNGLGLSTFDIASTGLAPGDVVQRLIDIHAERTLNLSVRASPRSRLTTDRINGLRLTITRCAANQWVRLNTRVRCASTIETLLTNAPLAELPTLVLPTSGASQLLIEQTLPTRADNRFQGLSTTVTYAFSAATAR